MLIVFGAGDGGRRILVENRFLEIECFVDNDSSKWGKDFYGYTIQDPTIIRTLERKNLRVIVASSFYAEIHEQLKSYQLVENIHYWNAIEELEVKTRIKTFKMNNLLNPHVIDTKMELQRRALEQTVDFIEENLMDVQSFHDRYELLDYAMGRCEIDGLILEFGVYKGETINYISSKTEKMVYGFDSFEGLPERWRDGYLANHFSVDELPKVNANVQLIKGWFNASLPAFIKNKNENAALLHIDCDLYSSTQDVFRTLEKNIVKGTVIVFDEFFNYPGWQNGEFKAFSQYVEQNNVSFEYIGYTRYSQQVAVLIK